MRSNEQQSGVLYELCALLFPDLQSPQISIPFAGPNVAAPAMRSWLLKAIATWERLPPVSPAGVASLMLGASLTLMLSGSLTFMIGFMMMPWVLGMVALLYFLGIVSSISGLCMALTGFASPPALVKTCTKEIDGYDLVFEEREAKFYCSLFPLWWIGVIHLELGDGVLYSNSENLELFDDGCFEFSIG